MKNRWRKFSAERFRSLYIFVITSPAAGQAAVILLSPAFMQSFSEHSTFTVEPSETGARLDIFLVHRLDGPSRSLLLKSIRDGRVLVNGKRCKPGYRVQAGEKVLVEAPSSPVPSELVPEQVDFTVLYEDDSLLVIDKPAGLVVHPAAGHASGTLAHGLAFHCGTDLPGMPEQRPGIVHRLDKDTSGVMVVAKTEAALRALSASFRNRTVDKVYHAVLLRCPARERGRVVAPIARHPVRRKKMAIRDNGRYAATRWQVLERFAAGPCLVELSLETGRTHQIRVHMASLGCPVAGDELYGGKSPASMNLTITRQLLHASSLAFTHPDDERPLVFTAPLPEDMQSVVTLLRGDGDAS